ncbi:hypothetical protein ANN_19481 [Periplaneta americana]|uniref:Uncharacterized protein n=1 Tax=Periplaneta americana TaxID=6978 RepID=A0ABQ8SAW9_PERAM|nr:hypothetical protein ANN_19481 [Periplaneta americana]
MEKDLYGEQRRVWTILKNRRKPINEYLQVPSIEPQQWRTHFKKLYDNENNEPEISLVENDDEIITPIPIQLIQEMTGKLENRKSPGVNNISNEIINYGGQPPIQEIYERFKKI